MITKGNLTDDNYEFEAGRTLAIIKSAILLNISLIQIREKNLSAKNIYQITSEAVKLTANSSANVLVNERADIAWAANADGVHLTSNSLPPEMIRRDFPADFIVGISTHTLETAQNAKIAGADFVTFSPIFPTRSKGNFSNPQGLEKLREICEKLKPFPVLALGGIGAENFQATLDYGASGFAGISFLNSREMLKFNFNEE